MNSSHLVICLSASSRVSFLLYGLSIICLTSATVSASNGGNEIDYHALLSFKSTITLDPYKVLASWNHSFHFCDWGGNLSFLREISLENNSFQGAIPHELGRLSRLRYLNLYDNKFSGVIPTNLSCCSNLEELWLGGNKLAGSIPNEMSLLLKLAFLVIEDNMLTGGIPPFLGNITSMEVFSAVGNLTSLEISKNILTGGIPPFLGNITSMEVFSAVGNLLGGSIPYSLGLWKSLTEFDSGECNLYGSIPHSIFNLSLLVNFSLPGNHLTGSLPTEIGNQLPNLEWLQLRDNELTGILPHSISNCSKLRLLDMTANSFSGKLTIDFFKLRDIYGIYLANNDFHGRGEADDMSFIDSLKNCTRLVYLELQNCNLIGVIPLSIGSLVGVTSLYLQSNRLQGKIPTTIGKLKKLQVLNLYSNQFSGPIPDAIGNLSLLTQLYLGYNKFEGHIPSSLGYCKELNGLDLSNNRLSGKIPKQLLRLPSLTYFLDLSYNSLYGSIPSEIKDLKMLSELYLSYNNLSGTITSSLDVATALDYLHNHCQTTIVHGDLKPSNILLDADMVAHVGDFGLARLLGTDLNQNSSTGVKGTIGYAPPEYGIGSEMTSSGDVYSFGILLLEVMTGKKPTDGMFNEGLSLHKFAYVALPDHAVDVIDNDAIVLQSTEANAKKVEECLIATIKIGVSCSLDSPPQRMKIEIVVIELQRILDVLQNI
ncbi:leucine-rich repeat protein [Tanacetum coccineum]